MSLSIRGGLKLGLSKVAARGWLADIGHKDLPVGAGEGPKPRQLDSQPALSDVPEYPPGLGEEGVSEVSETAGMVKKCPLQPGGAVGALDEVPAWSARSSAKSLARLSSCPMPRTWPLFFLLRALRGLV
jgi:hypothetical protein